MIVIISTSTRFSAHFKIFHPSGASIEFEVCLCSIKRVSSSIEKYNVRELTKRQKNCLSTKDLTSVTVHKLDEFGTRTRIAGLKNEFVLISTRFKRNCLTKYSLSSEMRSWFNSSCHLEFGGFSLDLLCLFTGLLSCFFDFLRCLFLRFLSVFFGGFNGIFSWKQRDKVPHSTVVVHAYLHDDLLSRLRSLKCNNDASNLVGVKESSTNLCLCSVPQFVQLIERRTTTVTRHAFCGVNLPNLRLFLTPSAPYSSVAS